MKAAKFNLLVVVAAYFCFGNGTVVTLVSYAVMLIELEMVMLIYMSCR